jgi:twinkle protein
VADLLRLIPSSSVIIVATDGDGPGTNLLRDLTLRLGKPRCKFVTYPLVTKTKRAKDLNEVLEHFGQRGVVETINRAAWYHRPGVYAMSELPEHPEAPLYNLGLGEQAHKLIKLRRGDFWVVSGMPGHGKSALVEHMLNRVVLSDGLKICFASFEKNPKSNHRRDLRKWFIAETRDHDRDEKWTRYEIEHADDIIERCFQFVVPSDDDDADLEWLVEQFSAAVIQRGCDVCVVDPWNEIEHVRPNEMSLTEYTGYAIKRLKRLAKHLDVPVIVVAHPAKQKYGDDLTLHSISDSAHWANKSDVGIIVDRDMQTNGVKVRVCKVRFDDVGRAGELKGAFDTYTRHFQLS